MQKVLNYENGLKLVVESLPSYSVAAGIFVNAGSKNETAKNNGISHFLEHMIFKGTDKLNAFEIATTFEGMGAGINAFTSKDCTCYHFKALTDVAEKCFEALSHIFFDSIFDKTELDREKGVVIEEIGMIKDNPEDVCYENLAEALYDGPLARSIIGTTKHINAFDKAYIDDYINDYYHSKNITVAFAGDITLEKADEYIKKYFLNKIKTTKKIIMPAVNKFIAKDSVQIHDYEQSNLMLAFPSIALNHQLTAVQSLLSVILGGGMGSRLFQSIRERQGLAYSVYSHPSVHVDLGSFNICINYSANNTKKVISSIKDEIELLINKGVTTEEFNRAKAQLKASMAFAQESVQTQMFAFGKLLLLCNELYDMRKRLKEIEKVSIENVLAFAKELFDKKPALAYLGKQPDAKPSW
ncbi:MAG: insulinase family protein [Firmicutes bacterium]|nr:insulinase family protein [Bacillota bacterium]